jgi:ABC-type polysaccharide/polyol phosphate export permease
VPIFYSFESIPERYHFIYHYNPVARSGARASQDPMEGTAPPFLLMWKLALSSLLVFAAGWYIFRRLERRFFEHL